MIQGNIRNRLERLEIREGSPDRRQIEEDARTVRERLSRIAGQFVPADMHRTAADLLTMSPAQHFAWASVFRPDQAEVRSIMRLHGRELAV